MPETTITVGPSDWEADGVVRPRTIHVAAFAIDAFEITEKRIHPDGNDDPARAAAGLARAEVRCILHTITAVACRPRTSGSSRRPARVRTRYPWGDTGAVCRRAAWGLEDGPCAHGALGPDTVGAHGGGDTRLGVHDLAGNVAEWVAVPDGKGVVLGGSYRTKLAAELRVWSRAYVAPAAHDPAIGGRCAYDKRL